MKVFSDPTIYVFWCLYKEEIDQNGQLVTKSCEGKFEAAAQQGFGIIDTRHGMGQWMMQKTNVCL